jgi:Family of unknown function (DUF5996)
MSEEAWPALTYDGWKDTYATLHLWTQIVGKVALAQSPPVNHSWGIAFHLTARGLSTLTLQHGTRTFTIEFDFIAHELILRASDGDVRRLTLAPRTVADFYARVMAMLAEMALPVRIWPVSVEMPEAVRLDRDVAHHHYDAEAANRFWRLLTTVVPILNGTRCSFVGKTSPVHFFWGGFDVAVTRFSGRVAPPRDGPAFMREAYSHEVISHGFWPGSGALLEPAFYAYAVPEPEGLRQARVRPAATYYHQQLGEFILPYDAVRTAAAPEQELRDFVQSTYDAAATLAHWDRPALERALPR